MPDLPTITTFAWVPPFARGFVRDLRARWAFEEVGQPYAVALIRDGKTPEHRRRQPFGQVPTYRDDEVEIFESGAIVLRIAERAGKLLPADPGARMRAIQWTIAALNSVGSAMRHGKVVADLCGRLGDLEAALGGKTWLDGADFTVGDLMMVSVLGGLRETDMLDRFPGLAAYVARGEARPAHAKAMADQLALYEDRPGSGTCAEERI